MRLLCVVVIVLHLKCGATLVRSLYRLLNLRRQEIELAKIAGALGHHDRLDGFVEHTLFGVSGDDWLLLGLLIGYLVSWQVSLLRHKGRDSLEIALIDTLSILDTGDIGRILLLGHLTRLQAIALLLLCLLLLLHLLLLHHLLLLLQVGLLDLELQLFSVIVCDQCR